MTGGRPPFQRGLLGVLLASGGCGVAVPIPPPGKGKEIPFEQNVFQLPTDPRAFTTPEEYLNRWLMKFALIELASHGVERSVVTVRQVSSDASVASKENESVTIGSSFLHFLQSFEEGAPHARCMANARLNADLLAAVIVTTLEGGTVELRRERKSDYLKVKGDKPWRISELLIEKFNNSSFKEESRELAPSRIRFLLRTIIEGVVSADTPSSLRELALTLYRQRKDELSLHRDKK